MSFVTVKVTSVMVVVEGGGGGAGQWGSGSNVVGGGY